MSSFLSALAQDVRRDGIDVVQAVHGLLFAEPVLLHHVVYQLGIIIKVLAPLRLRQPGQLARKRPEEFSFRHISAS